MVARLYYQDPAKYHRSCDDCRIWVYDESTGDRVKDRTRTLPNGEKADLMRVSGTNPPCHSCPKTIGLPSRHWRFLLPNPDPPQWAYRCFQHWRQCEGVRWNCLDSEDSIVRRNAMIFGSVVEAEERSRNVGFLTALGILKRAGENRG